MHIGAILGSHAFMASISVFCLIAFLTSPAAIFAGQTLPHTEGSAGQARKKLIFINFYNTTGNKNTAYLESSIVDSIHELIKDKYAYDRVTRAEWDKFVKSSEFTPADYYDPEKLQKIGAAFKADGIIFGKLASHGDDILITGKILSVVEKEVIAEREMVAPLTAEMFEKVTAISEALASKIKDLFIPSDLGALRRSAMLPGWGQFYKQRKTWGYFWGISVGTAFLTSSYFTYAYFKSNSAYKNAGPEDDPAGIYKKVEFNYTALQIGWYVTLGLYLLNLADAYFFNGDYDLGKPGKISMLPESLSIVVHHNHPTTFAQTSRAEVAVSMTWRQPL